MGWVEDTFLEHQAYERETPNLWNKVRDSVWQSEAEFNARTKGSIDNLDVSDCTANGRFCLRLHKSVSDSILELFLDEKQRCLKISGLSKPICSFHLTSDRKELEFFSKDGESVRPISVEDVCKRAIGDFLFTPFPIDFRKTPK